MSDIQYLEYWDQVVTDRGLWLGLSPLASGVKNPCAVLKRGEEGFWGLAASDCLEVSSASLLLCMRSPAGEDLRNIEEVFPMFPNTHSSCHETYIIIH